MRDNFRTKTKNILASRVAYFCSFPGCNRITIGPGSKNSEHVISIGEAAHIHSAAPNGPRNNPSLTPEQRSSVDNGIWMCKTHSRLIDADEINYSAETILKWKIDKENSIRRRLENLEQETIHEPLTLVMFSIKLIIECKWVYVSEESWKFEIYNFIEGDLTSLYEYINKYSGLHEWEKFIIVESQGDGRVVESIAIFNEKDKILINCRILPKLPRTNPHELGSDLAMADDGDLAFENGDLGIVSGLDYALQLIRTNLSWDFGWWANPHLGSNFTDIYNKYHKSQSKLNSIVKLELVRLITVPTPKGIFDDSIGSPELSFVNRVNWVKVSRHNPNEPFLIIQMSLEWGNYETWIGELKIPFSLNKNE
jgi:hypothetical protein